ncbi:MAG: response regulator transcription factor [Pedobacter sp.]|nr:MAG: response regulator transcription factor [Pedobacter sp.]
MIKAILVDDESINIDNLNAILNKHCESIQVVGTALNVDQALPLIYNLKPDVVFLDIEMPIKNGFDLLKAIPKPEFEVVFVTAYDSYGIKAIKFSALDYLMKPINITELQHTVTKIEQALLNRKQNERLNNMLQLIDRNIPDQDQKIALPTQKEIFLVPVRDILRCESSNNYTTFFLINGIEHLISKPLYEYETLLCPYGFIRCHQSHLVNKTHVVSLLNEDSGYLILDEGEKKIPISKQRKVEVKAFLKI